MFGIDLLPGFDRFSKWLWEPLGGEPAAANHEPGYVEIPPEVRPPRRAHGPRTVDGFRPAVLRAYAAAQHYLCDGGTLAEAALTYDSNAHYVRGAIELLWRNEMALLDAAAHGDIPLLVAAYETDTATSITVITAASEVAS